MINLYYSNGKVFVWNVQDVFILRKEHRITGSLVGCYPSKTFQNQTKWLPLQLLPEEAKLLISKGFAQLVSIPETVEDTTIIESFYNAREKLFEEQIVLLKENRSKEILEKADVIYEGKKRKLLETLEKKKKVQKTSDPLLEAQHSSLTTKDQECEEKNSNSLDIPQENKSKDDKDLSEPVSASEVESEINIDLEIDKDAVIEAELAKVSEVGKELCMVQLFTEAPWKNELTPVQWKYPSTEAEKLRYAIYKDLWEKGYYITTGSKFGGDFLAYEGDPLKYHALFIVVCVDPSQKFQGSNIVIHGRLGHQVKKTVALASLDIEGEVNYVSISWEGEVL